MQSPVVGLQRDLLRTRHLCGFPEDLSAECNGGHSIPARERDTCVVTPVRVSSLVLPTVGIPSCCVECCGTEQARFSSARGASLRSAEARPGSSWPGRGQCLTLKTFAWLNIVYHWLALRGTEWCLRMCSLHWPDLCHYLLDFCMSLPLFFSDETLVLLIHVK